MSRQVTDDRRNRHERSNGDGAPVRQRSRSVRDRLRAYTKVFSSKRQKQMREQKEKEKQEAAAREAEAGAGETSGAVEPAPEGPPETTPLPLERDFEAEPPTEEERMRQTIRLYETQLEEASNTIILQDRVLVKWERLISKVCLPYIFIFSDPIDLVEERPGSPPA